MDRLEVTDELLEKVIETLKEYPDSFWENEREVETTDVFHGLTMDIPYSIMSDGVVVPFFNLVREQKS